MSSNPEPASDDRPICPGCCRRQRLVEIATDPTKRMFRLHRLPGGRLSPHCEWSGRIPPKTDREGGS